MKAVREEEVKLRGVGLVKEVGFKPDVKERRSYRCTEWLVLRVDDHLTPNQHLSNESNELLQWLATGA